MLVRDHQFEFKTGRQGLRTSGSVRRRRHRAALLRHLRFVLLFSIWRASARCSGASFACRPFRLPSAVAISFAAFTTLGNGLERRIGGIEVSCSSCRSLLDLRRTRLREREEHGATRNLSAGIFARHARCWWRHDLRWLRGWFTWLRRHMPCRHHWAGLILLERADLHEVDVAGRRLRTVVYRCRCLRVIGHEVARLTRLLEIECVAVTSGSDFDHEQVQIFSAPFRVEHLRASRRSRVGLHLGEHFFDRAGVRVAGLLKWTDGLIVTRRWCCAAGIHLHRRT